jgi:hypothetical protein
MSSNYSVKFPSYNQNLQVERMFFLSNQTDCLYNLKKKKKTHID